MNPTTEASQTPITETPKPQGNLQSVVLFGYGRKLGPAMLQKTNDRIVLAFIDPASGKIAETVLDTNISSISKVRAAISVLSFKANGKTYRVDFSTSTTSSLMIGGAIGLLMADSAVKKSAINEWVEVFKAHGINPKVISIGKTFKWVLIITAIPVGFLMLLALVGIIYRALN